MTTSYIGITIGPIFDTMELSSSPAGVWGASYLFSYLAHEIRKNLGLLNDDLSLGGGITAGDMFKRGVGLYHDRVIYQGYDLNGAKEAVETAVKGISDSFAGELEDTAIQVVQDFFFRYFNIHAVRLDIEVPKENPLLKINDALDALELQKNFPPEIQSNYILDVFENRDEPEKRNNRIRNSFLVTHGQTIKPEQWILSRSDGHGIRDLWDIASNGLPSFDDAQKKYQCYYAVIRADGDNMGKTIKEKFNDKEKLQDFSDRCMRYGGHAAQRVQEYGGVPIYAGGDDLLCIAPVMVKNGDVTRTFLDLIEEVTEEFNREFAGLGPTLSFGVQIQYYKSPLYEALNNSADLLFGVAKDKKNKPNSLVINLLKHSGQRTQLLIRHFMYEDQKENTFFLLNDLIKETQKSEENKDMLQSVGPKVLQFASLLETTEETFPENGGMIDNLFDNVFGRGGEEKHQDYLKRIKSLAKHMDDADLYECDEQKIRYRRAEAFSNEIRLVKFFGEKKGDRD